MPQSVFTKIKNKELPGVILYDDGKCFVILSNMPHAPGHLLVIPVEEMDSWQDLDTKSFLHLMEVAQYFGRATKEIYSPPKVSLVAIGFEVPHVHIHIFSLFGVSGADHTKASAANMEELSKEALKFEKYLMKTKGKVL